MNPTLKWKLIAGFLLVFIAGGVTGAFFSAMMARHFFPLHHGLVAQHMRERLRRELSLTPEQLQKITPAIERSAKQLEQIRLASARRVRQTFEETHREISENLTPDQRERLQRMHQRREHWMQFRRTSPQPSVSVTATPSGGANSLSE
jgi:Spy/CpxP family protein refolding chaperone